MGISDFFRNILEIGFGFLYLIGNWNIRNFGHGYEQWREDPNNPKGNIN